MGFTDLLSDAGLTILDGWTKDHSYIFGFGPSQADVKVFQTVSKIPAVAKYPHAYRWYKHIATFESDFQTLPGDPTKEASAYGPEVATLPVQSKPEAAAADDDDDVDLFGSESEDEETKRVKEERLAAYREKKAAKPKVAAKSIVTLDVKPWDDETDMDELEKGVRAIEKDGLVWGASKRVPVAAGVFKLQINLVVEDDKVSLDELQEQIEGDEDHVQSTDIAAMQKL